MNMNDTLTSLKPYAVGAVLGAIGLAVVGFSSGYIVTAETMKENVTTAQVNALAQVCRRDAAAHWKGEGNVMAALKGWTNQDRAGLSEQFSADLSDNDGLRASIEDRCSELLEPA